MNLTEKTVTRPVLFTIIFVVLSALGIFFYPDLPVEMMPDITYPMITIITTYSGAAPESVEKTVTRPIEEQLTSVTGVKELTSSSSEGRSRVMLEFEFGTNLDAATNDIRDKLDRVKRNLPDDADSPLIRIYDTTSRPIIGITVNGDRDLGELRDIAENTISDLLAQVEGVGEVSVHGGQIKKVQVELYQNRLDAYGITISSIATALSSQNMELGGGDITEGSKEYLIRTTGEFKNVEEIANAVVAVRGNYNVKLSDLGDVFMGYADKTSAAYINRIPSVYLNIRRATGANIVQTADQIYLKLEEIKDYISEDIDLIIVRDDSEEIRNVLDELKVTMLQGFSLVIAVLFIFLRSFKSTFIIGVSLPISVLITIFAMFLSGFSLNMMTLTGLILGLGMILDASIVVLENVYQHLDKGKETHLAVTEGGHEMVAAITSSTLTTIVVFIPFVFYRNQLETMGQMLSDVIFTIIISVCVSLFVAVFLVPVLATKYFPVKSKTLNPSKNPFFRKFEEKGNALTESLQAAYRKGVMFALRHRIFVIISVILLFTLGLFMLSKTRMILMPGTTSSNITLSVELPPGTELSETEKFMEELETAVLEELEEYKYITTMSGSSTASYEGEISIELLPAGERTLTPDEIKVRLNKFLNFYPHATINFDTGGRRGGGSSTPKIYVGLVYEDINEARNTAQEIIDLIKDKIPEDVTNTTFNLTDGLPQVEIIVDRQRAYDFGLSISDIAQEIRNAMEGIDATVYREDGNEYDVLVRLQEGDRAQIPDLDKIFLFSNKEEKIYLSNVASIKKGVGPMTIAREDKRRIATISIECSLNAKMNIVQEQIKNLIDENIIMPDGISYTFSGDWEDAKEQGKYMVIILIMAIVLIFSVMAGQYESFKNPFINMFTIPLLVIGVAFIYFVTGQSLSLFSLIGAVMLTGIVVNNGIVLVDYTNQLRARGMPVYNACIEAAVSRIRPILMTTLTTIFAMLPMALSQKEGPNMTQPIALTVLGGLGSAFAITLFFIPVVYYIFNETRENKRQLKHIGDK